MEQERINNIIGLLKEAGVAAELKEFNGEQRLRIGTGTVCPTPRLEQLEELTDEEIVERCVELSKNDPLKDELMTQVNDIYQWETIKDKVRIILLGSESRPDVITRPFLDLVMVPVVKFDMQQQADKIDMCSSKVTDKLLTKWGITEDELFEQASWNTKKKILIRDLSDIYERMLEEMQVPKELWPMFLESSKELDLFYMETTDHFYGAAAMCMEGVLTHMANYHNKDIVVLPSSVQEVILHPLDEGDHTPESLKRMVMQVNTEMTEEEGIKLSDSVYIYRRSTGRVEIFE